MTRLNMGAFGVYRLQGTTGLSLVSRGGGGTTLVLRKISSHALLHSKSFILEVLLVLLEEHLVVRFPPADLGL